MAYQRRILSDSEPVSIGSAVPVGVAGSTSGGLDTWNYDNVDFFVKVTDRGTATTASITVEYSSIFALLDEDWSDLHTEDITAGAAPQSIYSANFDISGESGAFTLAINVPTRGRYMRVTITPDAVMSGATFTAIRKV
jgi:hypothetical protein